MKKKDGFKGEKTIVLPEKIIQEIKCNPLINSLYVTDIGYYPRALYHYRERKKCCSENILIYCTEGKGWYKVNKNTKNVQANEFFILPANVSHCYGSDEKDPWTVYWVHFSGTKAEFFVPKEVPVQHIDQSESGRIRDRLFLFDEIFENLQFGFSNNNLEYANTCLWHLLGSFRYISEFRKIRQIRNRDLIEKSI